MLIFDPPGFLRVASVGKPDYVARLTVKRVADLFESVEIYAQGLTLFQSPQCCVADACILGQPVESSFLLFQ